MAAKTASLSVNIIADAAKARAGLREAETAFGKFRREVGESQGAMNKFRTISGSAFDYVKQNAMGFATAAAGAIATFVVKSVMGFQDLALAAGKFADATGLSTEEASRFIEVAGDIGVEASQVEKSIGFMNKTLGNSPQLFRELGIEIERTSSGATDVNGTFLNVIDRLNKIEDPAARAAAGTKLLGRSWMELSELVAMGADDLSAALANVADSKVISASETQNARDFRDEVDRLKDTWEGFANTIGSTLIPVLSDGLDKVNDLIEALGKIPGVSKIVEGAFKTAFGGGAFAAEADGLRRAVERYGVEGRSASTVTDELRDAWIGGYRAMIDARYEADNLAASLRNQAEDADLAKLKWDEFRNNLSIKQQTLNVIDSIEEFRKKWAGATDEAKAKSREYQQDLLKNQAAVANLALSIVGLATTAQNTRIRLLIDSGQLSQAWSLIQLIQSGMNNLVGALTPDRLDRLVGAAGGIGGQRNIPSGSTGFTAPPPPKAPAPPPPTKKNVIVPPTGSGPIRRMASGGTVTGAGLAWVGEEGPELVSLPRGASVIPSIPSRRMMGGGTTINVSVQAGLVSSPDQVGAQIIEAIRRAERRSGQVFASV